MNVLYLLGLLAALALGSQLIYRWRRPAFLLVVPGSLLLAWVSLQASASSLDIFGATLALEPAPRDFLVLAMLLTGALAVGTTLQRDRVGLSFLFWCWIPWVVALVVSDFVVAVFGWTLGLFAAVLAMRPRRFQRASGAAYFLVLVGVGSAGLLLANRLIIMYPLTPERTWMIQFAALCLAWGFGLLLALFPFHLWVAPMIDDTPLPSAVMILALGQPIGLMVLTRLLTQYSVIADKSDLFGLMALGSIGTVLIGGLMAAFERRAGRLLGYAAIFGMGMAMLDFSGATREGLAYSGMELVSRALCLALLGCAIVANRNIENRGVQRLSLGAFLLAGLSLLGLRLGIGFADRWNLFMQLASSDVRLFGLVILAHLGLLVGIVRQAANWQVAPEEMSEPQFEIILPTERKPTARPELVAETAGVVVQATTAPAVAEAVPIAAEGAPGGNGSGATVEQGDAALLTSSPAEEYVFEEHVRQLAAQLYARLMPYVGRGVHALPLGARDLILLVFRSWQVWASWGLLLALCAGVLAFAVVPQALYERILAVIGTATFAP